MLKIYLINVIFIVPAITLIMKLLLLLMNLLKSLLNRRLFIQLIFLIAISSTIFSECHQTNQFSQHLIRIAVLPFDKSELAPNEHWVGWGIEETIFDYLEPDSVTPVLVYELDNLRKIIRLDTLTERAHIKKFIQKLKLAYYISGKVTPRSEGYQLFYEITSTRHGIIAADTVNFRNVNELYAIGLIIANKLTKTLPSGRNGLLDEKITPDAATSVYFFQATELLFDNKIEDAKALLNQAIIRFPQNAKINMLAGSCFLLEAAQLKARGNSFQQAIEKAKFFLTTAHKLDSMSTKIRHYFAQYYIFTHNWIAAEQEIQNSYRINRNDPELYVLMAKLNPSRFTKFGFRNEIELLEYALFLNPGHISAALGLSTYYVDYLQDPRSAIKVIKEALAINPEQPDLLAESGRLYVMSGDFLKIMPVFEKILKIAPSNANVLYNLGIYYYNQKDYHNASRLFERAIELDAHLDSHLYLAYIYEQMALEEKNPEQHQNYVDKAIENFRYRIKHKRDPKDPYSEIARAHLYKLINNESLKVK